MLLYAVAAINVAHGLIRSIRHNSARAQVPPIVALSGADP